MSSNGISPMVSVIVPVGGRQSPMAALYAEYKSGLCAQALSYEFIFVLDGPQPGAEWALLELVRGGEPITIVSLTRYFGEATAIILTMPAHLQVEGAGIGKLIAALGDSDVAVGYREPHASSLLQRLRRRAFHRLLEFVTRQSFRDLGCNARAINRRVLQEVHLYGDQQRFLPLLAERQGFRISQVPMRQSKEDRREGAYRARTYTQGFLDIFTVFFLVRFTKKPLRFFGMIGVVAFALGIAELLYLVFERLYFHSPLADRPALLLASLLIVLGVQIFALGLLGELIIFTHAGTSKDYKVDRVVQYVGSAPPGELSAPSASPRGAAGAFASLSD
jgi:hypothetical protein